VRLWLAVRIPQPLSVIFLSLYKDSGDIRSKGVLGSVCFTTRMQVAVPLLTQR
jgi:hypothetical protein